MLIVQIEPIISLFNYTIPCKKKSYNRQQGSKLNLIYEKQSIIKIFSDTIHFKN